MNGYSLFPPDKDHPGWRVTCPKTDGACSVKESCADCPFNEGIWVAELIVIPQEEKP